MWLVAVGVLVVGFASVSLWLARLDKLRVADWLGAAFLTACVAGAGIKMHLDQRAVRRAAVSIAWPTPRAAQLQAAAPAQESTSQPAAASNGDVAPVASLIGGLERRLEQSPDDGNGWALLAQSYAFTGDGPAAEKAVAKAVALGVDEQTLRKRVTGAQRGSRASDGRPGG